MLFKGTPELHFIHYSWVVIILLNTGLFNSIFSTYATYSFGTLLFRLSVNVTKSQCHNTWIIIIDVGVKCSVIFFDFIKTHFTKTILKNLILTLVRLKFSTRTFLYSLTGRTCHVGLFHPTISTAQYFWDPNILHETASINYSKQTCF